MTTAPVRSSSSPEEHVVRIITDDALPAPVRRKAVRWQLGSSKQLASSDLHALLASFAAEPDDELWAGLLEILSVEHPDSLAVWSLCQTGLSRCAHLPPRRLARILESLLTGGVSCSELADALAAALGEDGAVPVLGWLFAHRGVPADITGALHERVSQGLKELRRSTLMLHGIALWDAETRAALGQSGAYTRYQSLYWALQDWPYASPEDLAGEVQQGVLSEEEAVVLSDFSAALRSPAIDRQLTDSGAGDDGLSTELDRLGRDVMVRLHLEDNPCRLFALAEQREGDT